MELSYDSRRTRESGRASDSASQRSGGGGYASNSALTAALSGDTPSDPGLGSRMAARMAAAFGPGFGAAVEGASAPAGTGVIQMKPIGEAAYAPPVSGSPAAIRSALEEASSVSLEDVRIHYDSPKPAEIGALAYAKGADVFMGPGQERYLGHELTHVVQQKQGLVHSTGSVGGMPVNTSPSLESAADHMQVSAAPEAAASASGGVVQGVFVDASGKQLSDHDVDVMISMMIDSLGSHQKYVEGKTPPAGSEKNQAKLSAAYRRRKEGLRKRYMKMAQDKKQHVAEDEMSKELNAAQKSASRRGLRMKVEKLDPQVFDHTISNSGTQFAIKERRKFRHDKTLQLGAQDTRAGYDATEGGFSLTQDPSEAYAELSSIPDYDPETSDFNFDELRNARMECSNTFLRAKNHSSKTDATQEDLDEQATRTRQFNDAAETARQGAVDLRKADTIGFGDLYTVFSGINRAAREGDAVYRETAGGGKIRGRGAGAAGINGVGSGQLPEAVFRTLSTVAAKMNEIKNVSDPGLRKTQAIQLAAFAEQVTVAEHVFEDGNGRSCRLLADTILQTFGLPPHSPLTEEAHISGSIGDQLDYKKGAKALLDAVMKSDQIIQGHSAAHSASSPANASSRPPQKPLPPNPARVSSVPSSASSQQPQAQIPPAALPPAAVTSAAPPRPAGLPPVPNKPLPPTPVRQPPAATTPAAPPRPAGLPPVPKKPLPPTPVRQPPAAQQQTAPAPAAAKPKKRWYEFWK